MKAGGLPESEAVEVATDGVADGGGPLEESDDEALLLAGLQAWVEDQGLPAGESDFEAMDLDGHVLAIFGLAWPQGLQYGLSHPVAVLIDEDSETIQTANAMGYRFFTDADDFKAYVMREVVGDGGLGEGGE